MARRIAALPALAAAALAVVAPAAAVGGRPQTTLLISRSSRGGVPNGPSFSPAISNDRRFARVVAFESDASNIVRGDNDHVRDVFAVRRAGPVADDGARWRPGNTIMVSRTFDGRPADGPSFAAAVDGSFRSEPSCVAFLSAASNLVPGDTNGKVDAFVSRGPGGLPERVSLPGDRQSIDDTRQVAVSGDCSRIAFTIAGKLYVRTGGRTVELATRGAAADPSFSTGVRNDLVFGDSGGVYLSRDGTGDPRLVAPGGSNPAFNDIKREVVAYQRRRGGHSQVLFRQLGGREQAASAFRGRPGNGDSVNPVIGNSGYYIAFETRASNLGSTAARGRTDHNRRPDVYLYTGVRRITIAESVRTKGRPIGGRHPGMSFYANYIVFDAPGRHGRQVLMRWLGGL
jgi:hypothetical protein